MCSSILLLSAWLAARVVAADMMAPPYDAPLSFSEAEAQQEVMGMQIERAARKETMKGRTAGLIAMVSLLAATLSVAYVILRCFNSTIRLNFNKNYGNMERRLAVKKGGDGKCQVGRILCIVLKREGYAPGVSAKFSLPPSS